MKKIIIPAVLTVLFISIAPTHTASAVVHIEFIRDDNNQSVCAAHVDTDGESVTSAVRAAASACKTGFDLKYWSSWGAHTLEAFGGAGGWADCYWMFDINGTPSMLGMDDAIANDGDKIEWTLHNSSSCRHQDAYSTAGEGIVGLINPTSEGKVDLDGDGSPDVDEYKNGTNPKVPEEGTENLASAFRSIIYMDADGDGVADLHEYRAGTDPYEPDQTQESKIRIAFRKVKEQMESVLNLFIKIHDDDKLSVI